MASFTYGAEPCRLYSHVPFCHNILPYNFHKIQYFVHDFAKILTNRNQNAPCERSLKKLKLMILAIFLLSVYISRHISKNEMRVDCKDLLLKEMTLSLERRQPVLDSYSAAVGFSMIHTVVDMSSHLVLFPCYKIKLYFFPFISITTHMPTVNVQESKKNQGKE